MRSFRSWVNRWWKPWMAYGVGFLGFAWASVGFFNFYFKLGLPRWAFNQYSEIFVVVIYGIPLIIYLKDPYQKVRMAVMITLLFTFWYVVPTFWSFKVDWYGTNRPWRAGFPSWDVPGTWTHASLFAVGLLFGRRVKCGWMNTCVAIKETAGAPFRKMTVRGPLAWAMRRVRTLTGLTYVTYFVVLFLPSSKYTQAFFYWFWTSVIVAYFSSFLLVPLVGSRAWCRFLCPLMFGWTNVLGFFRLRVDTDRCNECGACEKVCDMGIPIVELSKKTAKIRTTECMGCGRCQTVCQQAAISYFDVRDYVREEVLHKSPRYLERPIPALARAAKRPPVPLAPCATGECPGASEPKRTGTQPR
jgi:polyferredoxin